MKTFLVTLAIVGLAFGDVSHLTGGGYHYKVPHTSYGVPSHQVSSDSNVYNTGFTGGSSYKGYNSANVQVPAFGQQSSNVYQTGSQGTGFQSLNRGSELQSGAQSSALFGGANQGFQGGYQSGSGSQYRVGSGQYQTAGNNVYQASGVSVPQNQYVGAVGQVGHQQQYQTGNKYQNGQQYQSANQYQTAQQYQSSVVNKYQDYYKQQQQQPAQVFKHFYVHVAPEEPEQPKFRQPVAVPPPQKHYKIVFIKTPTPQTPVPQFIPVQQQNEEKTIVYVLVPKPEAAADVVIPQVEQKPPSKPEVFFVKYSGKEGSQTVINNIVNDYNKEQAGQVSYSGVDSSAVSGGVSGNQYTGSQVVVDNGQHSDSGSVEYSGVQSSGSESAVGGSQSVNLVSADSSAVVGGYQNDVEASAVAQTGFASGEAQTQENYNTVSTSQGVPHETYGPPKFRA